MSRSFACLVVLMFVGFLGSAGAASQKWQDLQGNSFKAEPSEALGPLALFRTGPATGRMLAWRALSPADCARFYEQVRSKPGRSEDWATATSTVSTEMNNLVSRVEGDKLVPARLAGRPEPEFFILFFANSEVGKSWDLLGHSVEPFNRLQQAFPGQVEGLFVGLWHKAYEHEAMAMQMHVPWLVANFADEKKLKTVMLFAPTADREAYGLVVINRDGVPVFSAASPEDAAITKVFADLTGLLELMRPGNPRGWQDRAHYLRAAQTVAFASGHADPILVGDPLVPEGLRRNKVERVDASIAVGADGVVTEVTLNPGSQMPARMVGPLSDALKKAAVFVPAVTDGNFVAGTFNYVVAISL